MDPRAWTTRLRRLALHPVTPTAGLTVLLACLLTSGGAVLAHAHFFPELILSDSAGTALVVRSPGTVADALAAAGMAYGPEDALSAPLQCAVTNLKRVHIQRAIPVTITTAEGEFELWTRAREIADLKADPRLALSPTDRLWPRSGTAITPGMQIKLARVTIKEELGTEPLPPPVDLVHDPQLPRGASVLVTPGKPGKREVRLLHYFKDGVFSETSTVAGRILEAAVPEIRKIGIRALTMGRNERGNRVLLMEATAYEPSAVSCGIYASGYTATGRRATYGVCAVDPRVIPLGTRLFIEGYGVAIAADVGGAIKGMKIDVCYDTVAEALRWGRRTVKVYILDDMGGTTMPIMDRAGVTQKLVAITKPAPAAPAATPAIEPETLTPADLLPDSVVQSAEAAAEEAKADEPKQDALPAPINLLPTG